MPKIWRKWEFLYHLVGVNLDNYLGKQIGSYLVKGKRAYPMTEQSISRYLSTVFKLGMHNPGVHEESLLGTNTFKGINCRPSGPLCNVYILKLSVWEYILRRGFTSWQSLSQNHPFFHFVKKKIPLIHLQFHNDAIS